MKDLGIMFIVAAYGIYFGFLVALCIMLTIGNTPGFVKVISCSLLTIIVLIVPGRDILINTIMQNMVVGR